MDRGLQGYVAIRNSTQPTDYAMDIERALYLQRDYPATGFTVEQRWYAHQVLPPLLIHEIEFTNNRSHDETVGFT